MPRVTPYGRYVLALMILTGAMGLAAVLVRAQVRQAASSVSALPEHSGWIQWTAIGDAGGRLEIRYTFHGFYLWSAPILSAMGPMRLPPGANLADMYTLFPMRTDVSVQGTFSQSTTFERPGTRTDCWTSTHSVNSQWTTSAPSQADLESVLVHRGAPPPGFQLPQGFEVSDRRAAGAGTTLTRFQFHNPMPGDTPRLQSTFTDYDSPGAVDHTATGTGVLTYMLSLHDQSTLRPEAEVGYTGTGSPFANFWYEPGAPVPLDGFDPLSPKLAGSFSTTTDGGNPKCSYLPTDESFTFEVRWNVGIQQAIDATLEPLMDNEAEWMPEYNQIRTYRVSLNDPGPEAVGRLRVSLTGTSSHPGIATNAVHHAMEAPTCAYCTKGVSRRVHTVSHDFHGLPVSRRYNGLNECPIDHLPDMFFMERDNPGFTLVNPVTSDLVNPIGQVIELADATEPTYEVAVLVKDSAASARLFAEVEIGGQWYPVKAIGSTADPLGSQLQLPRDADHDSIADRWEEIHSAYEPTADADNIPGAVHPGDGLTNFEEYRGIYSLGQFHRVDPEQKTIFVHDYTGRRLAELLQVRAFYAPKGLQVFPVDGTEFLEDVVNYQTSEYTAGAQYIAVLAENPARPADVGWRAFSDQWLSFAGMASHVGPPQRGLNLMALQYRVETATRDDPWVVIGHELAHLMNVPHHGDRDGYVELAEATPSGVPAGRQLAAIKGGQHSGDFNCIMKYEAALLFCKTPFLLPYNRLSYDDYPRQSRTPTALCHSAQGTGTNADGAWAGDATRGNCTAMVKVRSY